MPRSKEKSKSKPSMIVETYKRYQRRKKFEESRAWEDEYFYIYDLDSDERVMENLELAGKIAFVTIYVAPLIAIGATAGLVKYFFF